MVDYCFKWNWTDDAPGVSLTEDEDAGQGRRGRGRTRRSMPVASNWEPIPSFGDYRSIARYERDGQAVS